jgi:hypothetical protein
MRECSNFCENRLLSYLSADNAPFTTTPSFPPLFGMRSVKTDRFCAVTAQPKVKTDGLR